MKRVAMFVTNPCTHDARVMKEASTLSGAGYDVCVFALANAHNPPGRFEQDNYTVHRVQFLNIFARARSLLLKIIFTPVRFIKFVFKNVSKGLFLCLKYISYAFLSLPAYLLKRFAPTLYGSIANGASEVTENNKHLNKKEHFYRKLRLLKVNLNIALKRTLPFKTRVVINRFVSSISWFFIRVVLRCYLWLKRVYSKIKRFYILSKSFTKKKIVKNVNSITLKLLMPLHKISTYYYFCKTSSRLAIEWKADVAHAHDLNTMLAAHWLKKTTGAKVIYDSHELWIHRNRVGRKAVVEKSIDKLVERWLIKDADQIITVCDSIGDWLVDRYKDIPSPVILRNMPYSIDLDVNAITLKKRLGIPEDALTLIYTGKFTTGRGILAGIHLLSKIKNIHFVMLGYGDDIFMDDLNKKINSLGVQDRLTICPPVPYSEVTSFISGADLALVYIEPICLSYEYALPNKLFESIQAGIPILGANLIEIEKLVTGLNIGICFDNESDLAESLKSIDPLTVTQWKRNINSAKQQLCWERESEKLTSCYSAL